MMIAAPVSTPPCGIGHSDDLLSVEYFRKIDGFQLAESMANSLLSVTTAHRQPLASGDT
jgi:hypothetical protein